MRSVKIFGYGLMSLIAQQTFANYYIEKFDNMMNEELSKNVEDADYKRYLSYPILRLYPLWFGRNEERRNLIAKQNMSNAVISYINGEKHLTVEYSERAYQFFDSYWKDAKIIAKENMVWDGMKKLIKEEYYYMFYGGCFESYGTRFWRCLYECEKIDKTFVIDNRKKAVLYERMIKNLENIGGGLIRNNRLIRIDKDLEPFRTKLERSGFSK